MNSDIQLEYNKLVKRYGSVDRAFQSLRDYTEDDLNEEKKLEDLVPILVELL